MKKEMKNLQNLQIVAAIKRYHDQRGDAAVVHLRCEATLRPQSVIIGSTGTFWAEDAREGAGEVTGETALELLVRSCRYCAFAASASSVRSTISAERGREDTEVPSGLECSECTARVSMKHNKRPGPNAPYELSLSSYPYMSAASPGASSRGRFFGLESLEDSRASDSASAFTDPGFLGDAKARKTMGAGCFELAAFGSALATFVTALAAAALRVSRLDDDEGLRGSVYSSSFPEGGWASRASAR
jgi:hypothetical protein